MPSLASMAATPPTGKPYPSWPSGSTTPWPSMPGMEATLRACLRVRSVRILESKASLAYTRTGTFMAWSASIIYCPFPAGFGLGDDMGFGGDAGPSQFKLSMGARSVIMIFQISVCRIYIGVFESRVNVANLSTSTAALRMKMWKRRREPYLVTAQDFEVASQTQAERYIDLQCPRLDMIAAPDFPDIDWANEDVRRLAEIFSERIRRNGAKEGRGH